VECLKWTIEINNKKKHSEKTLFKMETLMNCCVTVDTKKQIKLSGKTSVKDARINLFKCYLISYLS